MQVGRTIPSFRIAAEMERARWRDFRSLLPNMKDRKLFDEMFSYARLYNSACMMQASPIVFQPVIMSILFQHYMQLMKLKDKKNSLVPNDWIRPVPVRRGPTLDDYCWSKLQLF